jgi:deoxyribodipyrimidine photo-lyase
MQNLFSCSLMWFRRDLRVEDNAALALALRRSQRVHCAFIFDTSILLPLPRQDRRVEFIRESLVELDRDLRRLSGQSSGGLITCHAAAAKEIPALARALGAQAVFAAHDYEPQSLKRDAEVARLLLAQQCAWVSVKDHVIFENLEVVTRAGKPYTVFTPYHRAWLERLAGTVPAPCPSTALPNRLAPRPPDLDRPVPSLEELGFIPTNLSQLRISTGASGARTLVEDFVPRLGRYDSTRDYPALKGPSYLGMHLRFGTASIRQMVALALPEHLQGQAGASCWLGELAWRDFYFQIMANFPHVSEGAFKPEYDRIAWEDGALAEQRFAAWCNGQTGYPLVDAAMAQLNQTGYMHNRLRMVSGSFLVKHLGLDWRWGERYFAEKLNDFDFAANNGGWQWVSSSGCDAQPFFRIFNPVLQSRKFDLEGKFIRRYVPQLAALEDKSIHAPWLAGASKLQSAGLVLGRNYPLPIVDLARERARTLLRYAVVSSDTQAATATAQYPRTRASNSSSE